MFFTKKYKYFSQATRWNHLFLSPPPLKGCFGTLKLTDRFYWHWLYYENYFCAQIFTLLKNCNHKEFYKNDSIKVTQCGSCYFSQAFHLIIGNIPSTTLPPIHIFAEQIRVFRVLLVVMVRSFWKNCVKKKYCTLAKVLMVKDSTLNCMLCNLGQYFRIPGLEEGKVENFHVSVVDSVVDRYQAQPSNFLKYSIVKLGGRLVVVKVNK